MDEKARVLQNDINGHLRKVKGQQSSLSFLKFFELCKRRWNFGGDDLTL